MQSMASALGEPEHDREEGSQGVLGWEQETPTLGLLLSLLCSMASERIDHPFYFFTLSPALKVLNGVHVA